MNVCLLFLLSFHCFGSDLTFQSKTSRPLWIQDSVNPPGTRISLRPPEDRHGRFSVSMLQKHLHRKPQPERMS